MPVAPVTRPEIKNPWARWAVDALERIGFTFIQAWAATIILLGDGHTDHSHPLIDVIFSPAGLKVGAGAGVLALAKALVASRVGAKDSASLLPKDVDPPQPAAVTPHGH